jgi:hypothetical protein
MANVLGAGKQTAIFAALAEGPSIRSIERIAVRAAIMQEAKNLGA